MNATAMTVTTPTDGTQIAMTPAAMPTSGNAISPRTRPRNRAFGASGLRVGDAKCCRKVRELEPSGIHPCFAHRLLPRVRAVGVP